VARAEDECLLEMPFQAFAGVILVHVTVDDSPALSFIVDSGATMSAITDPLLAESLGLEIGESGLARGIGAGATQVFITTETTIRSHGFPVLATSLVAHDIGARLERIFGRAIDGFLGSELFDRYVVEIDPVRRVVALHDPGSFSYRGDGEVLPLEVVDQRPVIPATVTIEADKKPVEVRLMVDSGSARFLTLVTGSKRRLKAPPKRSSSGSVGVSGTIEVDVAPVAELQIGSFLVRNVETTFLEPFRAPAVRNIPDLNGVLGNGLLSRFRSFFDYGNSRLILEPLDRRSD
jgi:hypothetical protein